MNRLLPRLLKRALPLLPVLGHGISADSEPAPHPNIVYFLVDDMGYADCTFNGGTDIKTPNIDRLAAAGTILKSFYVQPLCSPTRSALLTGCYPTRTGVYHVITPGAPWGMPLDHLTIADVLKKAGYFTAICGKWHLGEFRREYRPNWRGFDHQYGHMLGNLDYFTHLRNGKLDWYRNDQPLHEEGYTTELIAREACRVIREHSQSHKPLFLYVPFNAIHSPYQVPEHYLKGYEHLTGRRKILAGMMAAADVAIGRICAELERQGMRKNTLIIFSSDNGGTHPGKVSLNTPLRGGKGSVYEGGVRVPAFVTWPGKIPAGKVIDEPLHIVDW
ncbi:MAG: arylsulfatase, partial [Lentisphaerae bacterium]